MKPQKLLPLLPHLMLFGAALFWGLNPMLMKIGLEELDPLPYNTLRLFFGMVLMLPVLIVTRSWKPIPLRDIGLLAIPVFGFFAFQFLFSFGVAATSASVAAIILGTLPIMVALVTFLFRIESLGGRKLSGIGATVLGVFLLAIGKGRGLSFQDTYVTGVLLLALSELAYGFYTVFLKPLTKRYSTVQIVAILMITAFLLFASITVPVYGTALYSRLSWSTILSALSSGVLALAVGNLLWSGGVRGLGSVRASVYGNLPPVFGVMAGFLVLNEHLAPLQLAGAAAILVGIVLVNRNVEVRT